MRVSRGIAALLASLVHVGLASAQVVDEDVTAGGAADLDAPDGAGDGSPLDPRRIRLPGDYVLGAPDRSAPIDVGGGEPLTLGRVLASVERHHPTLEAARQGVRAAEGEQLASEGGFDLSVRAEGWGSPQGYYDWARASVALEQPTPLWGATVYSGWRIGRGDVPDYYGEYETLDLGELRAGVRVPLLRDGPIDARRARIARARQGTAAERAAVDARRLSMRLDATRAYVGWVAAGLRYRIAADLLALAEDRDAQIRARVQAGALPPIEALENRRVILARRGTRIAARRGLERAAIALSLYHRDRAGGPLVPDARALPESIEPGRAPEVNLPAEVNAAVGRRPELRRYAALLERQRVAVELADNQLLPRLDVGVAASVDVGGGVESDEQARLGTPVVEGSVLITMPLQLREARGGQRRTRAELAALEADAQLARDRVATEVQDAFSALRAADDRLELARESAEVATAVAEAERRRFELGATSLFVVNLREQAAAEAQAMHVDAQAELRVARASWMAATGRSQGDADAEQAASAGGR